MPTIAQLAERYDTTTRSISRWRAAGAPLDNPRAMRQWLATRKHLPPGTRGQIEGEKRRQRAALNSTDPDLPIGAAAALTRLEQTEAVAFRELQAALRSGDPIEIKLAREGWLKVGDSLRRYDLALEQSRRDAGELLPRSVLETLAQNFGVNLKRAFIQAANATAPELAGSTPAEACEKVKGLFWQSALDAFATLAAQPGKVGLPQWLIRAAVAPITDSIRDGEARFLAMLDAQTAP